MPRTQKKQYEKPCVTTHGSVEQVTGFTNKGHGEFMGGFDKMMKWAEPCKGGGGPADLGS